MNNTDLSISINNEIAIEPSTIQLVSGAPVKIVNGTYRACIHLLIKLNLIYISFKSYKSFRKSIGALSFLVRLRRQFLGDQKLKKMVKSEGKFYMGLYTPGWGSKSYDIFIQSQLNDYSPLSSRTNRFNNVVVGITKKCALQCEHCYEWDNLNKKDFFTAKSITQVIQKLQMLGVSNIHLTGGEPLLRMDIILEILNDCDAINTDFWITTSGFKLTQENAIKLKQAGLTGVVVSIDHFIPEEHNKFRGFKDAFFWAQEAVKNANKQKLITALSLCATNEFISSENLLQYMNMAKSMGVGFVQILEPKQVGHYKNKEVQLSQDNIKILEDFFIKMNFDSQFETFPILSYHGYHQRRVGCYSSGKKSLYVDTDGDINPCPFCHLKMGSVLENDFEQNLEKMVNSGCHL